MAITVPLPKITGIPADRERIEAKLSELLSGRTMPEGGPVHEAMRYAVLGGGQRIRPLLALRVAQLAGADPKPALEAAAAVELIHCASLIVDDLPCMDDEQWRRESPTVHVAFGEATAVLAAFGLVALAGRSIVEDALDCRHLRERIAFQTLLLRCLDCSGLIAGQAMDLQLQGQRREQERTQLTELKTVPLFLLAARAGLAFAGAGEQQEREVMRFAREYGIAFQMADDYLDGELSDLDYLNAQYERTRAVMRSFGRRGRPLMELVDYLHARTSQKDCCRR
ncbi:MAG: polyprenyl synthetase family protein [Bryobacteraceae bacterium]|nr:polyprenyl synthetase family protein [Bryobacteraceae bacterium]